MQPLLSIIIPVYNCAQYIERCVESIVCNHVDFDLHLILVNDGSKDNSDYKCRHLLQKYPSKITYIRQENKGASSARNMGLDFAIGDYIWFIDADDCIDNEILPYLSTVLKKGTVEILTFNHGIILPKTIHRYSTYKTKQQIPTTVYLQNNRSLYLWNKIYRRDTIDKIRFLDGTKNIEDFLFNIEVMINTEYISCIPVCGYLYNTCNQQSTSRNLSKRNLIKLSQDSFNVHKALLKLELKERRRTQKRVIRNLLSFSIAGHLYSLYKYYNIRSLKQAINIYREIGLYPISYTYNFKANILLFIVNTYPFRLILKFLSN